MNDNIAIRGTIASAFKGMESFLCSGRGKRGEFEEWSFRPAGTARFPGPDKLLCANSPHSPHKSRPTLWSGEDSELL